MHGPSLRALLLDLYGTLVWADWPALRAGRAALARLVGVDEALMLEQWRRTHRERMLGAYDGLEGDLAEVLRGCGVSLPPERLGELAHLEYENWARGVHLYEDTVPQLQRLRQAGYRLAIVSNSSREAAAVVDALGLGRLVDAVVVSWQVGSLKPEAAILQVALDRLGAAPGQALLVDDDPVNLDAARSLGLATVLMVRQGGPPDHSPHPSARTLADLWPLLQAPGG